MVASWQIVNLAGLPLAWDADNLTLTVPANGDATTFVSRREAWTALKAAVTDTEQRKHYSVRKAVMEKV